MRFLFLSLAGLLPSVVTHPVDKRAESFPPVDSTMDESVLQLALYLEHLETALYTGGFNNFTDAQYTAAGFPSGFRENVGVIAQHEVTHASTISEILLQGRLLSRATMHLQLPLQLSNLLCRPRKHDHLRRHWRLSRRWRHVDG